MDIEVKFLVLGALAEFEHPFRLALCFQGYAAAEMT